MFCGFFFNFCGKKHIGGRPGGAIFSKTNGRTFFPDETIEGGLKGKILILSPVKNNMFGSFLPPQKWEGGGREKFPFKRKFIFFWRGNWGCFCGRVFENFFLIGGGGFQVFKEFFCRGDSKCKIFLYKFPKNPKKRKKGRVGGTSIKKRKQPLLMEKK